VNPETALAAHVVVDADIALEAVERPVEPARQIVIVEAVVGRVFRFHGYMDQELVAHGTGRPGHGFQIPCIGHESEGQGWWQGDAAPRVDPVEAQVVDHDGDHRAAPGIAHGHGILSPQRQALARQGRHLDWPQGRFL
jgi:hypothetical protein